MTGACSNGAFVCVVATWIAVASACTSGNLESRVVDGGGRPDATDARPRKPAADAARAGAPDARPSRGDASFPADARTTTSDGGRPYGTDRSTFFGASRCSAAHLQLCEDFEGGSIDRSTWDVVGLPTVDGMQKARGSRALHVLQVGNGAQYVRERKTFPEPNDAYWGRVFVYFEQLPAPPMGYAHWTFIAASGTGVSGEIRVSGQRMNGDNWFGVGTDSLSDPNGTGDWTTSDQDPNRMPRAVPLRQWLCIEWLHSGATNETRFFQDGVEHPSLHTTETTNGGNGKPFRLPQFDTVWIGWQEYQSSTETFELWVDEIAIDPARIGCVL